MHSEMPIPKKPTLYAEMSLLDRVIDNVLSQNKEITQSDLNQVVVAAQPNTPPQRLFLD
jgi:hypothetical protein